MDRGTRRFTNTRLIDDLGRLQSGDFLIKADGSFSVSKGDEYVEETIEGSNRLITRSFQNWHTHMAMVLNKKKNSFRTFSNLNRQSIYVEKTH